MRNWLRGKQISDASHTLTAIKVALLRQELQQGLSRSAHRLRQAELEEEVAQQNIEFVCPISILAGTDKAQDWEVQGLRVMNDPVTGATFVCILKFHAPSCGTFGGRL